MEPIFEPHVVVPTSPGSLCMVRLPEGVEAVDGHHAAILLELFVVIWDEAPTPHSHAGDRQEP